MLIKSEHAEIALTVSSSSCLWHDEYIYHFTRVMQMQESCLRHAVSCLEGILCSDLPLMLLVYQVYEIDFWQYVQVGFEYGHEKCQLLYEQRVMHGLYVILRGSKFTPAGKLLLCLWTI